MMIPLRSRTSTLRAPDQVTINRSESELQKRNRDGPLKDFHSKSLDLKCKGKVATRPVCEEEREHLADDALESFAVALRRHLRYNLHTHTHTHIAISMQA